LSCFSRSNRASLYRLGPAAFTRKSIALPFSTFTAFRLEAKVDFPKRLRCVRIGGLSGREIRMRRGRSLRRAKMLADGIVFDRAPAWGARILVYIGQHALAGIFPHDLRSHHYRHIFAVGNLVTSQFEFWLSA